MRRRLVPAAVASKGAGTVPAPEAAQVPPAASIAPAEPIAAGELAAPIVSAGPVAPVAPITVAVRVVSASHGHDVDKVLHLAEGEAAEAKRLGWGDPSPAAVAEAKRLRAIGTESLDD